MTPSYIPKNNATSHGIQSNTEKWLWIVYLLIVFISSLLGDVIVLVSSIKYNAFKLNESIIALIQHIAVCDLTLSLAWVLPIGISVVAEDWIFGKRLAQMQEFIMFAYPTSTLLVCLLTTSKFMMVRYPLKTRAWTAKETHVVCGLGWLGFALYSLVNLIKHKDILIFDYSTYEIDYHVSSESTLLPLMRGSAYNIILAIIILFSILTLRLLLRARNVSRTASGSVRWQGILTVVLTATVFSVSSLPYFIYLIAEPLVSEPLPLLKRISEYLSMLNLMSNFYIYCMTVPSFRKFLRSKVLRICPHFVRKVKDQPLETHEEFEMRGVKTEECEL